ARCVAEVPTDMQAKLLASHYVAGQTDYSLHVGDEYTVLGLSFWSGVVWFEVALSMRTLVSVPAILFEVVSGRPSSHWDLRLNPDGSVLLWPVLFYRPCFHDLLSE